MALIENEINQTGATIKTLKDQITADQKSSSDLEDSLEAAREALKSLQNEREQQRRSAANLGGFIYCLDHLDCAPKEFDMEVFNMTVEKIFVGRAPNFSFRFFNGEIFTATWDTSDSIRAFMKPERS